MCGEAGSNINQMTEVSCWIPQLIETNSIAAFHDRFPPYCLLLTAQPAISYSTLQLVLHPIGKCGYVVQYYINIMLTLSNVWRIFDIHNILRVRSTPSSENWLRLSDKFLLIF
jgi:hypothetical protein